MLCGVPTVGPVPHLRSEARSAGPVVALPPTFRQGDCLALVVFADGVTAPSGWVSRRTGSKGVSVLTRTAVGTEGSAVTLPSAGADTVTAALAVAHPSGWSLSTSAVPPAGALLVAVDPTATSVTASTVGTPPPTADTLRFLL